MSGNHLLCFRPADYNGLLVDRLRLYAILGFCLVDFCISSFVFYIIQITFLFVFRYEVKDYKLWL